MKSNKNLLKNKPRKLCFVYLIILFLILAPIACTAQDVNNLRVAPSYTFQTTPTFYDDFNSAIDETVWQIATWSEHGGQTSRDRCYTENGNLKMIFENADGVFLSSAIQTRSQFLYGRWEVRLKPSNIPGILNSFYTIDWDDGNGTRQEIDIEFLTYSFGNQEGEVHYAAHFHNPEYSFETNPDVSLDFNPSDDFHVWGFEITPKRINWFVDDIYLKSYEYEFITRTINKDYQLKLNSWSQVNWINGPPEPNVECEYLIDWIKFYPLIEE